MNLYNSFQILHKVIISPFLCNIVCVSQSKTISPRACIVTSTTPGTKSHFSCGDRAVLGKNAEHRLTGYLQPAFPQNVPGPCHTSLLNILDVTSLQHIKTPWAFSHLQFRFLSWKLQCCTNVANSQMRKKLGFVSLFFLSALQGSATFCQVDFSGIERYIEKVIQEMHQLIIQVKWNFCLVLILIHRRLVIRSEGCWRMWSNLEAISAWEGRQEKKEGEIK